MGQQSHIEWTQLTWNPTIGCNKISEGCRNCYAETWAFMQQQRGVITYKSGFNFAIVEERLTAPFGWKSPKLVFVNSMSDLFHEKMPFEYLQSIFGIMNSTPQHTYQILTKRIDNLLEVQSTLKWGKNIWLGVSVENNKSVGRIASLRKTHAHIKFVSFEPLLEKIKSVSLRGIDWVIVGGESGGSARPIHKDWVLSLKDVCTLNSIPFFFKQWGKRSCNPDRNDPTMKRGHSLFSKGGCMLNGEIFRELPKY